MLIDNIKPLHVTDAFNVENQLNQIVEASHC